jgi:tetratricopeptide (TPR) repeat protein
MRDRDTTRRRVAAPRRRVLAAALAVAAALSLPAIARAGDPAPHYQRSYDLEAAGSYSEALVALDGVDSGERGTYFYRLRRGWLLYLAGRHWDSMGEYRKAIKLAPLSVEAHLGLSLPQLALRLWLDAKRSCEEALRLAPKSYVATSRLAYIHYNLGRFADAERLYRELLLAYPADVEMRVGLAWSLFKQQKLAQAMVEFGRVQQIAPSHPYRQPPTVGASAPR